MLSKRWGPLSALMLAIPALAQTAPERFWLAGRYDANRIIVYFDAVKFGDTFPSNAVKMAPPVAGGFFEPLTLPASSIARFQKGPNMEHFAVGDRYDLLLGGNDVATITLTSLVGFEGDEAVGNDSFIGALGTLDRRDGLLSQKEYYVVKHHRPSGAARPASLVSEPVPFDIQAQVASQLNERMRDRVPKMSLAFKMQPFMLSGGSLRYYVRAEWKPDGEPDDEASHVLAAWMTPRPTLHTLAIENKTSPYGFENELPILHNVVDLGNGKTGIIVSITGEDSGWLNLLEYRDGVSLDQMHMLQSIGSAE